MRNQVMRPARFVMGVASLALAALLLKRAIEGFVRGLVAMFAGAVALSIGGLLVGGGVWSGLRKLWQRRRASREDTTAL